MDKFIPSKHWRVCVSLLLVSSTLVIVMLARFADVPQFRQFSSKHFYGGDDSKCKPRNYIFYLKTHKTGSSTLASILYRYGDARNLTFVLPKGRVGFNWPNPFNLRATIPLYAEEGKILCSHSRYNKAPVNLLFPKPKSKYITILRHPINHFESVFAFFGMAKKLGLQKDTNPIETFLRSNRTEDAPERRFQTLRNPSMFDLGFDHKYFENRNAVMKYINYIEAEFDLVLINEHYDESLILLKNLLCWELEDILYLKHKVRPARKRVLLSNEVKGNILSWSHADVLLYKHFNTTLWRKISEAGPKFFEDLQLFRQKNKIMQAVCLRKSGKGESEVESEKNAGKYSTVCEKMERSIINYLAYTKKQMVRKWKAVSGTSPEDRIEVAEKGWSESHALKYKPVGYP